MALDRLDVVSIVGILFLVVLSPVLERPVLAALLAGFCCSVAIWRLYTGRPVESAAWVVWAIAAVALVVVPPGSVAFATAVVAFLIGAALLFASRRALAAIADVTTEPAE